MKGQYIGKIYEGRWEVIKWERYNNSRAGKYILRNIYNGDEVSLKDATLRKIDRNETSVSRVIVHHIRNKKYDKYKKGVRRCSK